MASRYTDVREWQTGSSPFAGQSDLIAKLLRELLANPTPPRRNGKSQALVDGCYQDGGLVSHRELVVSGGDGAVPPEAVDPALDRMALTVVGRVEAVAIVKTALTPTGHGPAPSLRFQTTQPGWPQSHPQLWPSESGCERLKSLS